MLTDFKEMSQLKMVCVCVCVCVCVRCLQGNVTVKDVHRLQLIRQIQLGGNNCIFLDPNPNLYT